LAKRRQREGSGEYYTLKTSTWGLKGAHNDQILGGSRVEKLRRSSTDPDRVLVRDRLGTQAWVLDEELSPWEGQEDFTAQGGEVFLTGGTRTEGRAR
jgi:hypothetical protein